MRRLKLFEEFEQNNYIFLTNLVKNDDFINGEYWQSILNVAYDIYNQKWNYSDMINNIDNVCDYEPELFKFAVLIGKYNQQVGNGGHTQYYDNGYASYSKDSWSSKGDIDLHNDMVNYFEDLDLKDKLEIGKDVYNVINSFEVDIDEDDYVSCEHCDSGSEECPECYGAGNVECPECGGDGEDDDGDECPNCGGEGEVECSECGGEGKVECSECGGDSEIDNDHKGEIENTYQLEELDSKWYDIDDDFEKQFTGYLKSVFRSKEFQEKTIEENVTNVIYLYKSGLLNDDLKNKYNDIIDSEGLGLL